MSGSILNILIKLIAVLMAILLWFYVISQKQYEYELTLPVAEIDFPAGLGPISQLPDSLAVKVFAEGKKLLSSKWKKAGLRLKASRLKRGVNRLDLNLETVSLVRSEDITLLDLPEAVAMEVRLDRIDSVVRPVASRLVALPAEGYMVISGREKTDPVRTTVIGPALLLKRIDSVYTEQKILDDLDKSRRIALRLEVPENMALTLEHDSVTVEVEIDRIKLKLFENISVTTGKIPSGGRVIVDPDRVSIEVAGPETIIDTLSAEQISVWARLRGSVSDGYVIPHISLPPNVNLKRIIPDSIRILVSP